MSDFDLAHKLPEAPAGPAGLVPVGYAEKAMASLMQLHSEVLEEKERRVDLHRRLMEKEQALAELKMYVKLLEEKLDRPAAAPRAAPYPPAPHTPAPHTPAPHTPAPPPPAPIPINRAAPPRPPAVARQAPTAQVAPSRASGQGWKAW